MGATWSSSTNERQGIKSQISSTFDSVERPRLIPTLPDEQSMQILARVPRGCYGNLRMVCKRWNNVLGDEIFKLREELGVKEEWLYILLKDKEEKLHWYALDPISCKWYSLPRMPDFIQEEDSNQTDVGCKSIIRLLASIVKCLFGCRDPLDRTRRCGSGTGSLNGHLYVLGGCFGEGVERYVCRYDPRVNLWTEVASMATARAYCKTASLNNKLYAVGGAIGRRGYITTLQSAEAYDPITNTWKRISGMPVRKLRLVAGDGQPIAAGMEAFRGKLCVRQILYQWPPFVDMHGEMYDPDAHCWIEMPFGMGGGWPVRQTGTKLSCVLNGNLYALHPLSGSGEIKMYDPQKDAWEVVLSQVPESPYLLVGFMGKLHVITKDNRDVVAILQADTSNPENASSSSSTSLDSSESEGDGWRSIATKKFDSMELVDCQVVDI